MILTVSGSANRRAAWTAATLDLQSVAERPLAGRASSLADSLMVGATGAGGFLLGVAGTTIPDTFSERHAVSFRRGDANSATGAARHVPAGRVRGDATLPATGGDVREVHCQLLPR
jgi:hypothetical protein